MAKQGAGEGGYLEAREGRLTVDSVDVGALAEQYGTPLYVFSEKRIIENIRHLRGAVQSVHPRVKLCYASKANSNMAVLAAVKRAGGDIEVNSGGELFKAKKVGFRPDQIVFNGVSKTDEELRDAIDYGILAINIDSLYELDQVARVARSTGKRANIAIRIVPEIVTRSHIGLQTGCSHRSSGCRRRRSSNRLRARSQRLMPSTSRAFTFT
jgi:diaminopimelate decarboxylase